MWAVLAVVLVWLAMVATALSHQQPVACQAHGPLPDPACTPGMADPSRDRVAVCTTSTRTVRPPVEVTERIKVERMAAYGYTDSPRNYELDHLVSLEIGGSPVGLRNLWPQPYTGQWNAHIKDRLENELHRLVCRGDMDLADAQQCIARDWVACYEQVMSN